MNERATVTPVPTLPGLAAVWTLAFCVECFGRAAFRTGPAAHTSRNATCAPDASEVTHPESVPLQVLDPLTSGYMYHTVLARFLRRAVSEKLLPLRPTNLEQAQTAVDEILLATAAEYHEQFAPAIERVWQDEIELLRADLRGLVTQIAERADDYTPEFIEFGFGLPADSGRDPGSTSQAAKLPNGYLLHGIVDLVEGNVSDDRRVTDHKTGKNRTEDGMVVGGGEVLQPVLYSLAVEELLGRVVKEARLSFCTAVGAYTQRSVLMNATVGLR